MTSSARRHDAILVGSGIAGLFTALRLAGLGNVALITKAALEESNTRYAQGGIAAVMFDDDNVELHVEDTLRAGAGLCDVDAVRVLCNEGPARIHELLELGVQFDLDDDGAGLARGVEAAHSRHRVLHAGGDATGARIEAALAHAVRAHPRIEVYEHTFVTEIVVNEGVATGVRLLDGRELQASATVLASGGAGQVYRHTTNPAVATGDGVAAAFRAGAIVSDVEFFQFHPTALAVAGTFLVSEAVRGEGAVLLDAFGERFVDELAPRDVVARAIATQMAAQDGRPVVLDATRFKAGFLAERFPNIDAACKAHGFDWSTQPIPVTPAAHYWMGGVHTDTFGRTSLTGLYACGEVASTGVHGANRLASNSLLEGLVFGARIATAIGDSKRWPMAPSASAIVDPVAESMSTPEFSLEDVQQSMWDNVGLAREADGLRVACKQLDSWAATARTVSGRDGWELSNLLLVGRLIATAALARNESRGAHYRVDALDTDPRQACHLRFVRC